MQTALKLVLEPIFDADFKPCSYGFRPRRRAQDAFADLIRSKELPRRAKDVEHLAVLYERFPDLVTGSKPEPPHPQ